MNRNYKIGIIAACIAVILISIPVYLFWMYSPEAVYQRGLASAFWLSLGNDTRDISVSRGETKTVPVELHHWKDLDTALYVELGSDGRDMGEYPTGLYVSYDLDSSVISLSKGAVMVQSKNEAARFNPPMIKQVSSDGDMVVREFGNLTVSASKDVPLGSYYFELRTGDTKIDGGGGNSQSLTVTVVDTDSGQQHDQKSLTGNLTVYMLPANMHEHESKDVINMIYGIIGDGVDAAHYTNLGASPKGQYADEKVTLTEQNITPELQAEGFKVGDTVEMTVYKKPAETVKFYIDSAIIEPDNTPITRNDIVEYYSFGNGITCCGFTLKDGTDVGSVAIIVVDWAFDAYLMEKLDELKKALRADERAITVTVDVSGEPQQAMVETGMATSLMTTYLPVNITQTINLTKPTENITIYPVFADWDGIVRGQVGDHMLDENKEPISFTGFANLVLHGVNATCTEPYFVEVKESDLGEDGMKLENTTAAVSSSIFWGDTIESSFDKTQSGIIYYTVASYGIVPENYNDNNDSTYRTNGAGNQEVSGTYHLSFSSFYPATVNLPEQADLTSFLEVTCNINHDSPHVPKSEFPNIFVYDVWFRIE